MTKEQAAQEKRVKALADEAADLMGLTGQYVINHTFDTGYDGDHAADVDGYHTVHATTAITRAQWPYKVAQIRWFLPVCALQSDSKIFACAVHEYVHVLLNPIDEWLPQDETVQKLNEYVTESITRAILHASDRLATQ